VAEEDIAGGLHHLLAVYNAAALVPLVRKLAAKTLQHGILRLLDLKEQRFVVTRQKQADAAEGTDGTDAYRLECQILQREAIEQPQSIRIEALAIRGEQLFDAKLVSRIGFGIQMEDRRRLIDDPRIVAADEMREIVIR
jgi:hypothetical protein